MVERWRPGTTPAAHPKPKPPPPPTFDKRPKVYLWDDTTKWAFLVKEGPTQSEVQFPNGNLRVVANSWIKPLPERPRRLD